MNELVLIMVELVLIPKNSYVLLRVQLIELLWKLKQSMYEMRDDVEFDEVVEGVEQLVEDELQVLNLSEKLLMVLKHNHHHHYQNMRSKHHFPVVYKLY
jgi:GTP-sensing pleiotropic transcriptional regulator CodY